MNDPAPIFTGIHEKTLGEKILQISTRLSQVEMMLNSVKALYGERDKLVLELKDLIGVNGEVTIGDTIFTIVDNFAEKNTCFRQAAVKRFDLETDSVTARTERMMKESSKKK